MTIGKLVMLYLGSVVVFFAMDLVWLSTMTTRFYQPRLGELLAKSPKLGVAAGFYLLYVIGIIALAVVPGLQEGAVRAALWRGALFGLLAYATYDLSNLATIQGWPWQVAVVDMVWGMVVTSAVSVIGFYLGRLLGL